MSKVHINLEEIYQTEAKDENNNAVQITKNRFFKMENDYVYVQTDYLGNIYIKHTKNDTMKYYIVSLDPSINSGIELTLIAKPDSFRNNLLEMQQCVKNISAGTIRSSELTLRGKVHDSLENIDVFEDKEEYMNKHKFNTFDESFVENKYYWVKHDENDSDDEDEIGTFNQYDPYYLNGIANINEINLKEHNQYLDQDQDQYQDQAQGIIFSDLLSTNPGTFDTIFIIGDSDANHVISSVERKDGQCVSRLTIYSSGQFRCNFIDTIKYSYLCINTDTNELVVKSRK
jgi:hypothetical protein